MGLVGCASLYATDEDNQLSIMANVSHADKVFTWRQLPLKCRNRGWPTIDWCSSKEIGSLKATYQEADDQVPM